jgi:hypothetical protein
MLKTTILGTAIVFGAAAPTTPTTDSNLATAEQTILHLPAAEAVIAQFSYMEISHGADGFGLSITDKADMFVDLEFPGDLHIRIGL